MPSPSPPSIDIDVDVDNDNIQSPSTPPPLPPDLTPIPDIHSIRDIKTDINSRDVTPSTPSAASASSPVSQMGSNSDSVAGSASASTSQALSLGASASGSHEDDVDVDHLLKKIEMEKKMQAVQQRLALASLKATNGWTDMSIKEIENKLPTTPLRTRKTQLSILPTSPVGVGLGAGIPSPLSSSSASASASASGSIPYEPPSPSRPWQLIDVLWQPLPPPSHSRYPASPTLSSPKKRSRDDGHPEPPRPHVNEYGFPPTEHRSYPSPKQSAGSGHRRASSSVSAGFAINHDRYPFASPSSPLRPAFEDGKKKRSQSHSSHRRAPTPASASASTTHRNQQPTTSQDVDAAKALAFMLGSGSGSEDGTMSRRNSQQQQQQQHLALAAPLLPAMGSHSLPIPEKITSTQSAHHNSPNSPTFRPRALSQQSATTPRPSAVAVDLRTPNSHTRSRVPPGTGSSSSNEMDTDRREREEDKDAAELMMFLAHSPSPMKTLGGSGSSFPHSHPNSHSHGDSNSSTFGSAARVLFADDHDLDIKHASELPTLTSTRLPNRMKRNSFSTTTTTTTNNLSSAGNSTHTFATSNLAVAPPITPK